ncbi:MAG: TetR/AcrR family transcriptional regulator [Aggregatilineales bacterium]
MKTPDRRIERSRRALRTALVALIKEKDYDTIQILDITNRADTAKVTFYRHYKNKDELLLDLINVGWQQIEPLMRNIKLLNDITDLNNDPPTLFFFLLLESDRVFYKRLCQTPKLTVILKQAWRIGVQQISSDTPGFTEFDAQQIISCIIGTTLWWLLNDIPYTGDQMARITHWLSMGGVMGIRGELDRLTLPTPALRQSTIAFT